MRILLLSQWYPPEPQKVVSDLAETLRDCGHEVTVLTGFPNYPSGKIYPGYRLRLCHRETMNGLQIIRVPLFPDHSRNPIKRAFNYISFALACAFLGPWFVPKVDLIYVIHPPVTVGLPAWVLSKRLRVPFVYEIQDMWPETLKATGMVSNPRILAVVGRFAKWVYRRAAAIRVISPGFRQNLIGKGVPQEKVHVISNWVDTDCYRPVAPDAALAESKGLAGKFNVMFAGTLGLAQALETVVDAAALLQGSGDSQDIQFVFVGDGAALEALQQRTTEKGLNNVRFLGRQPSGKMADFYALADVLLIHLADDPLFRITIPHKTFAYLASAKPILAAVEGDVADVVTAADAGVSCPPCNAEALADRVRELHQLPAETLAAMGQKGRKAAINRYSRQALVDEVSQMLIQLTGAEHRVEASLEAVTPSKRAA
ncbi:glycosyltransferase family 4 protein [Roseimaritima ulvae]|uniref:GDP-mannose-dependent alpha-mannosyltransferase n=1 Tax=Roseimaritima ulvae TaxID=980254 RepID=A0A5B9QYI7_9BACT|nr:glycosyltransferase family 4 protein [Roseimaritima ulvae]QEG42979.1 GDP-mannose-dependent alpha-mannosyltransferase [Roseimaritima ulvae]